MQNHSLRRSFPALGQRINGQPLAYLDSAATTQKPASVIAAIQQFYRRDNANVHRGAHELSNRTTAAYELARERVAAWLGTQAKQVVWTSGTTAGINLLAFSLKERVQAGDHIVVSALEHHANLIPWQQLAQQTGAKLIIAPMDANGTIDVAAFRSLLNSRVKLVAFTHLSNVLGSVQPVAQLCQFARDVGAISIIDGAQAVAHLQPKPEQLGCDFYLFSGHKMYGPTGIGVLWGRDALLAQLPPWQTGGEMVKEVTYHQATFAPLPQRLEAGTPNIAGAIGMAAAVEFMQQQDWGLVQQQEQQLLAKCRDALNAIKGVNLLPYSNESAAVVGFTVDDWHPADVAQWLDHCGVAVRAGHHCAQPLHNQLGLNGSVRVSVACYSNEHDIDQLIAALNTLPCTDSLSPEVECKPSSPALLAQAAQVKGWEASYQFLIEQAKALPTNHRIRTLEYQVSGCDSRTWVCVAATDTGQPMLQLDSESSVVKGLLAIIKAISHTLPPSQWREADFIEQFELLGLLPFVSETRVNGITAVLTQIAAQTASLSAIR